jgi:predicted AAA+ superfamily ATPase
MHRVGRYDVKGKDYLQSQDKYYLADIGLRYYLLGTANVDQGRILENVVYLELLRRGGRVCVGKNGASEVDFVVQDVDGNVEYYQVSWSVREESTRKRELSALENMRDHNPKYLLTMDADPPVSYNGIRQQYALDWLIDKA